MVYTVQRDMLGEVLVLCALQEVRSFETELQLLKNLRHERIVMYFGTERTDGKLHIFMEYMPGVRQHDKVSA